MKGGQIDPLPPEKTTLKKSSLIRVNPNESDFRPFDSCIVQLLSVNKEGFRNSYCYVPKDTCGVFLDISKALVKILHLV